jgi:hypothetical protein
MDILKANRTDQRVPEWLREQMNNWNIKTVAELLKTDYVALRFLEIVTKENLKEFVTFLQQHGIYDYLRV